MKKHYTSSVIIVPKAHKHAFINKGSGIVAVDYGESYLAYYEGNVFNACNLQTYQECVGMAHDRLAYKAPTTSFCLIDKADMEVVGEINDGIVSLFSHQSATVAQWVAKTNITLAKQA
jgi:hypothetical protein